jgi:prolyl-tRNA synthetase
MAHGDDAGLILPPRLAPIQVVVVPIYRSDEEREATVGASQKLAGQLRAAGVRVHVDDRDQLRPGWKFAEWELKGVPVRLEIGPRDVASGEVCVAARHEPGKSQHPMESFATHAPGLMDVVQQAIYDRALAFRAANTHRADSWDEFVDCIDNKGGFVMAHWDGSDEAEATIQERTKATIRCIPLEPDEKPGRCVLTGNPSQRRVVFARSY